MKLIKPIILLKMDQAELNNIKSSLSITYVRAVANKLNYSFIESPREADGVGIDCTIVNSGMGSTNPSPGTLITFQVKAFSKSSTSMYKETEDTLEYKLNDNLIPTTSNHYLVIVEVPENENFEEWIKVTPESLTIKKCAYYLRVKDEIKSGFVKIPKTNLFTHKTLPLLFIPSDKKEDLL